MVLVVVVLVVVLVGDMTCLAIARVLHATDVLLATATNTPPATHTLARPLTPLPTIPSDLSFRLHHSLPLHYHCHPHAICHTLPHTGRNLTNQGQQQAGSLGVLMFQQETYQLGVGVVVAVVVVGWEGC